MSFWPTREHWSVRIPLDTPHARLEQHLDLGGVERWMVYPILLWLVGFGGYPTVPPMLAAWGPNMLFGAGGLYLFLTTRT